MQNARNVPLVQVVHPAPGSAPGAATGGVNLGDWILLQPLPPARPLSHPVFRGYISVMHLRP